MGLGQRLEGGAEVGLEREQEQRLEKDERIL